MRQIEGEAIYENCYFCYTSADLILFMKSFTFFGILFNLIWLVFSGCTSYHSILNYHQTPVFPTLPQEIVNYRPIIIQPHDILYIRIYSPDPVAVQPFNSESTTGSALAISPQVASLEGYLVGKDGSIDFPTLGKIGLSGLDMESAKQKLLQLLEPYFAEPPIVKIRMLNFRINVNGEVNRPGSFSIDNERVTLLDAITMAGDFTNFSRRDSILIIREVEGLRTFGYVDFNSAMVFSSPYFFLQQNDVLYIRPSKAKLTSLRDPASRALPYISAGTSLVALLIAIFRK